MKWNLSCKDASRLVSRRLDAELARGEKLALGLHLALCRNCARFARQLLALRGVLRAAPPDEADQPGLSDEARRRIARELRDRS